MAHAETCPVCGGRGSVALGIVDNTSTVQQYPLLCHGCGGLGWVTVEDSPLPAYPILGGIDWTSPSMPALGPCWNLPVFDWEMGELVEETPGHFVMSGAYHGDADGFHIVPEKKL